MKKKEGKTNYKDGKYSVEDMSDEEFKLLMEEAKEWFLPKMVTKTNAEGEKYQVDEHKSNLFVKQFLLTKDISLRKFIEMFKVRPWLEDFYEDMKDVQEMKLSVMGLERKLDSSMVKFTLSNKHNWTDKVENKNTHTVKDIDLKSLVGFKNKK